MAQPVLLGFMDAEVREEELGHFSYNKVGGLPDWASDPPSTPLCTLCSQPLLQVAQVYAPLSSSPYHRTLHLLACPQPPCWNQSGSWKCLRSQQKDSSIPSPAPLTVVATASQGSATDWLGEADDWGDEGDANGNPAPASPCPSTPSPLGASGGYLPSPPTSGGYLPSPPTNLNNSNSQVLDISRLSLAGDGNANTPGLGAAGNNTGGKIGSLAAAHAEVEMEAGEEDCVSLEEVARPSTDIPGLFCLGNRPVKGSSQLTILSHYLWVKEEGQSKSQEAENSQEQRLLLEYKAREALEQVAGGKPRTTGGGGEVYEEALPSHGDHFFHSLLTVIQRNPGQVLRYGRLSGSPPLLLRALPENLPPCSYCGSKTTFELQLLPSLVGQLRIDGVEGAPVEFGTVLVYSCEASCWQDGEGARSETVLVQAETM